MKQTKSALRVAFEAYVSGATRAEKTYGAFNTLLVETIKAANITVDDAKGKSALKERIRTECGLSSADMVKKANDKGTKVYQPRANRFIAAFDYAWKKVHPVAKAKPTDKPATTATTAGKVAKGLSDRMAAYALVLQDCAAAKTHAALSTNEAKQLDKLLSKLKALAELGYPD